MHLGSLPLLERLSSCERILLVGAGGGFDILAGVPLYQYLRRQGKTVFLASLSFSELKKAVGRRLTSEVLEVGPEAGGDAGYFPERYLSAWFASHGENVPVYCFKPMGSAAILSVYQDLVRKLDIDGLVLVDGGTDSLMRGDEPSLGTPAEDICSIGAAHRVDLPVRLLVNLGFGVDTFHGVCHAYVLEAIAELTAAGGFLGAFSLLPPMPEFEALCQAMDYIHHRMPGRESIVASSVVAAGQGQFGDYHATPLTSGSKLFINPLMAMYFGFEVDAVARRCRYLDYVLETYNRWDVHRAIQNYLYTIKPREWMQIPL